MCCIAICLYLRLRQRCQILFNMSRYYYDLHVHSCLSPCADNDMTPNNIANMAAVSELNIVALTDHNSMLNCPAFFEAADKAGITAVAGIELTTAEEIHLVCLFERLDEAAEFNNYIDKNRLRLKNKIEIFGDQLISDSNDTVTGSFPYLLPPATIISLSDAVTRVKQLNGVCYPAHIDRESNGIIAVLGTFPDEPHFDHFEINNPNNLDKYNERHPVIKNLNVISSSDAHHLWDINDKDYYFELPDGLHGSNQIRACLFDRLRNPT